MKAADISDDQFLAAMRVVLAIRPSNIGVTRWDLGAVLEGDLDYVRAMAEGDSRHWPVDYHHPGKREGRIPQKVVLAKAKRLINRGLIGGCACGCRGDFTLPESDAVYLPGAYNVAEPGKVESGVAVSDSQETPTQ